MGPLVMVLVAESCRLPAREVGYLSGCGPGPELIAKVIFRKERSG